MVAPTSWAKWIAGRSIADGFYCVIENVFNPFVFFVHNKICLYIVNYLPYFFDPCTVYFRFFVLSYSMEELSHF